MSGNLFRISCTFSTIFSMDASEWECRPMGETRRLNSDLTDGISEGRELTMEEASSGMYRRDFLRFSLRSLLGPFSPTIARAAVRLAVEPQSVSSSSYHALICKFGTLRLILSTIGWRARAKASGPSTNTTAEDDVIL